MDQCGSVGCGACASVLFPSLDNEEHRIETCVVGKKVSSTEYEVAGIVLGIRIQYFNNVQQRSRMKKYVCSVTVNQLLKLLTK